MSAKYLKPKLCIDKNQINFLGFANAKCGWMQIVVNQAALLKEFRYRTNVGRKSHISIVSYKQNEFKWMYHNCLFKDKIICIW